jgi:ribosomal-protein-alanine N-acetyltransferase
LFAEPAALSASGERVRVGPIHQRDIAPYRGAVEQSRERLARWNPVDPEDLDRHLPLQSRDYRTFLIRARRPEGEHDIVGKVNVVNAVRGRFESAAMGYDAYDPYAGRGLFADGLRLVLDLAFMPEAAGGMGLHRVAATVQPGNLRSAGLLRSLGFAREGFSPRMLWLPDAAGNNAWRDHDSYVMLADEWPSQPYRPARRRKVVALVNGAAASGAAALARELAEELAVPLFLLDTVREGGSDALWAFLADSPVGGVVQGCFGPEDARDVAERLRRAGVNPAAVPEILCRSVRGTESSAMTAPSSATTAPSSATTAPDRLLGLGPVVIPQMGDRGYPDDRASRADVVRIALRVSAGLPPAFET